jgi:hypothetical protein
MSCRKRTYRDEIAAMLALASCQRSDGSRREHVETRFYRCPRCRRFHLTHEPEHA